MNISKKDTIVFAGDTLTKNYPIECFFEDVSYKKYGYEGMVIEDFTNEEFGQIQKDNPTILIIEIGIDELLKENDKSQYLKNMENLVQKLQKEMKKSRIYIESLYPIIETTDIPITNEDIIEINKELKEIIDSSSITYIDLYHHLQEKGQLASQYSLDGIHLNEEGYARVSTTLRAYLKGKINNNNNIYNIKVGPTEEIVMIGDSLTDLYPINGFFENIPIMNNGRSGYTTTDILDNLKELVYIYNPSKVFLNIGINDMSDTDRNQEEIYENIVKIVEEIKEHRPNAKIYVQSIYPMNTSNDKKIKRSSVEARSMEEINYINNKLKEKFHNSNVTYIDVYKELIDENGLLKINYTIDGVHFTICGYNKISSVLLKYIAE